MRVLVSWLPEVARRAGREQNKIDGLSCTAIGHSSRIQKGRDIPKNVCSPCSRCLERAEHSCSVGEGWKLAVDVCNRLLRNQV
jgi:hypothetical protein